MEDGADDLSATGGYARPYPCNSNMIVAPSSVSITARKSGRNGPPATLPPWEVRATEAPAHRALAAALRKVQVLLPAALEADLPALGIGEPEPIKRLEPHEGAAY